MPESEWGGCGPPGHSAETTLGENAPNSCRMLELIACVPNPCVSDCRILHSGVIAFRVVFHNTSLRRPRTQRSIFSRWTAEQCGFCTSGGIRSSKKDSFRASSVEWAVAPKKGVARLSVNVNLDVPADYRTREFVSVADAVHAPSVLSVVVQRRSQIAAVRFLAALIVIIVAWRLRKATMLTKLTVAIVLLLSSIALLPLASNTWQSVLDGVAIGSVVSVLMALICGCMSCCSCSLSWFRRKSVSVS